MRNRLLVVFFGLIVSASCSDDSSKLTSNTELVRPAKIVKAKSAKGSAIRVYPGTVEAARKSDLAFRVGGQLQSLQAKPGMRFKEGEVMATLDDADYRNALKDRQAKFKLAKSQYDKVLELRKKDYASSANVDEVEANLKAAEAALATAEDNLKHTKLLAPFNGVVAQVDIENHQTVAPNQAILQFNGDEELDVRFSIPENLLGKLKRVENPEGFCSVVKFNAYPVNTYNACFKEFVSTPDRLTRTYSVVHTMPQITEFPALPGMAVTVEIDLGPYLKDSSLSGIIVPLEAVFEKSGETWVWKLDADMRAQQTKVVVDKVEEGNLIVTDGLQVDDAIIAAGVSYVQEGMQVKPLVKERGL